MADKIKKISVNAIERALEVTAEKKESVEWNGLTMTVKYSLTMGEMAAFVRTVVSGCIDSDSGEYVPEVRRFIEKACAIELYTNLRMPTNIESKYNLIYQSGVYYEVIKHIDMYQYEEIIEAIDSRLNAISLNNAGLHKIVEMMSQIGEKIDGVTSQYSVEQINDALTNIMSLDENKIAAAVVGARNEEENA